MNAATIEYTTSRGTGGIFQYHRIIRAEEGQAPNVCFVHLDNGDIVEVRNTLKEIRTRMEFAWRCQHPDV